MRERLKTAKISGCLTYSEYLAMHEEEPIILHGCLEQHPLFHWVEHIYSLPRFVNGEPPTYNLRDDFEKVQFLIQQTLARSNFLRQASEIALCKSEDELNSVIIRQYTEDDGLYEYVNDILRECHLYQNFRSKVEDKHDRFLAPWILQLNACIKRLPHHTDKAYRGTNLNTRDIQYYKKGVLFIWAPFVSASKQKDQCFGGNVLFEISSKEHFFGLHDKAYPRDISSKSFFPEEEEVLFPMSCAFRVENVIKSRYQTQIMLHTVDSY